MNILGHIAEGDQHAQTRFMAPLTESLDWVGISKYGAPHNKAYRGVLEVWLLLLN